MESARAAVALHQQLKTAVPCPAEVQQDSEAPSTAFKTMLAWTITAMNRWWASSLLYVRRRLSRLLLLFCCFLFLFWFVVYSVGWTDRTGRFCRWCHFGGALLLLLFFFFFVFSSVRPALCSVRPCYITYCIFTQWSSFQSRETCVVHHSSLVFLFLYIFMSFLFCQEEEEEPRTISAL